MTSINTNIAATTALRTLQATNSQLESTQSRISTGLKIGEAKDNAAYWSISTSLKSDNKAMGTVKDALGLGAATVDTAYQGLNSTLEVLNEIKAKLTSATTPGVSRDVIQSEIEQLQEQLKSVAGSSIFSGENWLSIDSSENGYSSEKQVVASFSRQANGAVSIGTIGVSLDTVALYDSGAGAGILDGEVALTDSNGVALTYGGSSSAAALGTGGLKAVAATEGRATAAATDDFTTLVFNDATDTITFDIAVNGVEKPVTIAMGTVQEALNNSAGDISISTAADMAKVVEVALRDAGVSGVTVGVSGDKLTFRSEVPGTTAAPSNVVVDNVAINDGGNATAALVAGDVEIVTAAATFEKASVTMNAFTGPMQLTGDAKIEFELAIDAGSAGTVTIDKSTVARALNTTDGKINTAYDMQRVIIAALADPNGSVAGATAITGVTVGSLASGAVTLTSNVDTNASAITVTDVVATADGTTGGSGSAAMISVDKIDISSTELANRGAVNGDAIRATITSYIDVVNKAIENVTTAAADLGSVAKRIELQQSFVNTLMDTIDKGVSGLVDADMNEESTRLQALQVKQQLGVQALSIANQSAQNVLSLFR